MAVETADLRACLDRSPGLRLSYRHGDGWLAVDHRVLAEKDDLPRCVGNRHLKDSFLSQLV